MTGHLHIIFAPLLSVTLLQILGTAAVALTAYGLYRRAHGSVWRGVLFALLMLSLANPSLIAEQREPLKDTALIVVDDSASMQLGDRATQSSTALAAISKKLAAFSDLDTEILHVKGSEETDLFHAVEQKLTTLPHDRLAGIIAITDGEIHDRLETPLTTPFHALIAGHQGEFDRRLIIKEAPAYGIVGKTVSLTVRVEDQPKNQSDNAELILQLDKGDSQSITVPVGKDVPLDVPVDHAGQNLFVLSTPALPNELTPINNTTAATINGIRDRLRVLLVSGQPHIGGRTWRNFLKADPAVDLVHFTILRSPTKFDMTPNTELSLIAFPVHELFATKLKSFDLVILDRFRQQSLVPDEYLQNIARYVDNGGALLVSSATEEGIPPLTLSPLAHILPTEPTGKLLTGSFVPELTEAGQRHPVTASLTQIAPRENWGPWFRQIGARATKGEVLMTGLNGEPLLVLSHVGQGRVAQFLSDQFWLWARNYGGERLRPEGAQSETGIKVGGGPQAELLRRIAHWLVQEPELDETALRAHGENTDMSNSKSGWQLVITKQSLHDVNAAVTVIDPQGQTSQVTLEAGNQAGVLTATMPAPQTGLYHVKDDNDAINVMVGPTNAPEFGEMRATAEKVAPIVTASGGGIHWLEENASGPEIHRVSANSPANGWNWIGLKQNGQYRIIGSKAYPLLPPWALIVILLVAALGMWRQEGTKK
jgi:hypothetical protein